MRVGIMMQAVGLFDVTAGANGDAWPKNGADEASGTGGIFGHDTFRFVTIGDHHNAGHAAQMKIPQLVASRDRSNQEIFGVPSSGVAEECAVEEPVMGAFAPAVIIWSRL